MNFYPPLNIGYEMLTVKRFYAVHLIGERTVLQAILTTHKAIFAQRNPLYKQMIGYFLTGALDHASRLYKSNLVNSSVCPFSFQADETAQFFFFWSANFTRQHAPTLLKLYSRIYGTLWPSNYLHGGWILHDPGETDSLFQTILQLVGSIWPSAMPLERSRKAKKSSSPFVSF